MFTSSKNTVVRKLAVAVTKNLYRKGTIVNRTRVSNNSYLLLSNIKNLNLKGIKLLNIF